MGHIAIFSVAEWMVMKVAIAQKHTIHGGEIGPAGLALGTNRRECKRLKGFFSFNFVFVSKPLDTFTLTLCPINSTTNSV